MSHSGLHLRLLSAAEANTLINKNILEAESCDYFIGKVQKDETKEYFSESLDSPYAVIFYCFHIVYVNPYSLHGC